MYKVATKFFGTFLVIVFAFSSASTVLLDAQPTASATSELLDLIRSNSRYNGRLDDARLEISVLNGIVGALGDPYAVVVDVRDISTGSDGASHAETTDLGIVLATDEWGRLVVQSVLPGSPAARAGVMPGERLLRVEETNLAALTTWEAMPLFSAEADRTVDLVRERGDGEIVAATLTATPYEVRTVELRIGDMEFERWRDDPDGAVAWLRVYAFLDSTIEEWTAAIQRIHAAPSVRRIVFDLRDNGGGSNSCVPLVGDFLRSGEPIVRFETLLDESGWTETVRNSAVPRSRLIAYPAVVLVNGATASLAEIAAVALRDNRAMPIVGETTYGKGTTQTWVRVGEHYAAHLTVGRWVGPAGDSIDGVGLIPDYVVGDDPWTPYVDEQLAGAVRCLMARR